jgi:hypothetical protein
MMNKWLFFHKEKAYQWQKYFILCVNMTLVHNRILDCE